MPGVLLFNSQAVLLFVGCCLYFCSVLGADQFASWAKPPSLPPSLHLIRALCVGCWVLGGWGGVIRAS